MVTQALNLLFLGVAESLVRATAHLVRPCQRLDLFWRDRFEECGRDLAVDRRGRKR
ncbi:hypothetical protein MPL1032_180114 [Mesorhizobium plurifarium]|uniref:Uncharacterized protein n=1 Tax=Mesorhizobium plurifarium TaxID=69974 RepID=A0A0K2VTN6_MESPL|nr:hypothetical protein MPL1032_180114 [Mesorhizobium plurifarium]